MVIIMKENQQPKTMQEKKEMAYQQHVEQVTPKYNLPWRMCKAFLLGGIICLIGQCIMNSAMNRFGLDKDIAGSWCSMLLVLLSVLLTGFNQYHKLVEWGGAGALVPITGFANSISSAAIEYQKEGQVFGIGCKIFTIAGPVILYGIFTSWILGVIYWILKITGIM
jgi:stage V sporulation protein AC